jgi:antitoxin YefM
VGVATLIVTRTRSSFAQCFGYTVGMSAVPLGDARDRLSEYVSEVERTHQRVTITRHGHPAAVLISADDLAAIEETLEILGTPGAAEAINEGLADAAAGRFADNVALKSRYGIA